MTTEQKLKLFSKTVLTNAKNKQNQVLADYESELQAELNTKKEKERAQSEQTFQRMKAHLRQDNKQMLAKEANTLKQALAKQTNQYIKDIFHDVRKELKLYKSTTKYSVFLEHEIQTILTMAENTSVKFYIDASDEALKSMLEKKFHIAITLSKDPLIGGILAKLPEKNLLVDETFATKLREAKDTFILTT